VSPPGTGSVSTNPSGPWYNPGQTVQLMASPTSGYTFASWGGDCAGQTNPCSLTMTGPRSVTVNFTTLETFTLTLGMRGLGYVGFDPPGIGCEGGACSFCTSGTCSWAYPKGSTVTLRAGDAFDRVFVRWEGACEGIDRLCVVSMTRDRQVSAIFEDRPVSLGVLTFGTGSGTVISNPPGIDCGPTCGASFPRNATIQLTATPAPGSVLDGWGGLGGACYGTTETCSVFLFEPRFVSVTFTSQLPALSLTLNQESFQSGETLYLSATVMPGATATTADVYVALALPDGVLLFLRGDSSLTTEWQPIVGNWTVGAFSGEIFQHPFSGWEPQGCYTWYAAFTPPGQSPLAGTIGPIVPEQFCYGTE